MAKKSLLSFLFVLIFISWASCAIDRSEDHYRGKIVRVVFDFETVTVGSYAEATMTNLYYEGIVKSYREKEYIILDVLRSIEKKLDKDHKEEKRIELKNRTHSINIIADDLEDYINKTKDEPDK